jgi:glutamine amidotransferase-like uncharacterized protein
VALLSGVTGCADDDPAPTSPARPLALVYRGPGGCPSCSVAAATLVRGTRWGFQVRYVGPDEQLKLTAANLGKAALYVQPGGDGTLEQAFAALRPESAAVRHYVSSGGRYLGLCMGGYLAGHDPGFNLLPGDADQFITSDGASVTSADDTVIKVSWRSKPRYLYFQDGPFFTVSDDNAAQVLATYTNGQIAALVTDYQVGRVAVAGPHPEATDDWYQDNQVTDPDTQDADLGRDLIDTLMRE